ncbi:hyaluronidase PH-20-like [Melitaea cinxia]|uniref:hyaluronidase PH-20-like n=1 Tax=Melitaea cinxia TaxID=113334 RepID=UPI001E271575|nr:hyaluronidase PH-20-like [Melitaea cinxia]
MEWNNMEEMEEKICVNNNYYVIEMPEDEIIKDYKRPFRVYWNVPTVQCKSRKVLFENLYEKYGIIQNDGDNFRGEKITILYEPGTFPAILKNETSGKYRFRNGGVPQEGNLDEHLKAFKEDLEEIVPDPNFDGIGIIDFESWRPVFRQNFGTLVPYKDVSYEIERKLHWWWPKSWINTEAEKRFETAARQFMQTTLSIAKQMRPKASWGYYGFPLCFNMAAPNMKENCSPQIQAENDLLYWMWSESSALYPSVYSTRNLTTSQLGSLIQGRVREAIRVRRHNSPVLPYYWFRYREGGYMTEKDVDIVLKSFYNSNASGFIIWGSSNDVNTLDKCKNLHSYVETILGPAISKYVKKINIANDAIIETPPDLTVENEFLTTIGAANQTNIVEPENNTSTSKVVIDPELVFIPPLNYTQDISKNVEEELIKKGYNKSDEITDIETLNDSTVVDMIFNALIKSDKNDASDGELQTERGVKNETHLTSINNNLVTTEAPIIKDLDTLNSLITKDPMGFIEKLADEEKKIGFLDDPLTTKEPINDKEVVGLVTKSSLDGNLLFKENQVLSEKDSLFDGDITTNAENIDPTTSINKFSEQKQNKFEDNTVPIGNDDIFIDSFDALFNANYKLEDENSNEYIKSEPNEFTTLKTDIKYTKQDDLTNKNDLKNITTDEYMAHLDENFTKMSTHTEENSQRLFLETKPTTEINLSNTSENDHEVTLLSENIFSNQTDLNEFDDLLLPITNTTDLDVESSTQYDNTAFDNNEDNLILLAVNLTNQSISDNYLKISEQTTESDPSTLSDSVVLESDEFILNNNKQKSFSENETFTTDAATDQVKVPSSFASGFDNKSIYIYICIRLLYFLIIFLSTTCSDITIISFNRNVYFLA